MATAIFGAYLGAQFIGGLIAGMIGGAASGIQPSHGLRVQSADMESVLPWTIFLTMLFGGIGVVWMALGLELPVRDTSPTGPAWVRGRWRDLAKGVALGAVVSVIWILFMASFGRQPRSEEEMGPLTRMGTSGGLGQTMWIISALLLAPPIEELLFRGIFYAGYRKSFGAPFATLVTTGVFVFLHFTEFVYQPLAIFAITSLALMTLAIRLRTQAIGPAIAVHFGYNAVIAAMFFVS